MGTQSPHWSKSKTATDLAYGNMPSDGSDDITEESSTIFVPDTNLETRDTQPTVVGKLCYYSL